MDISEGSQAAPAIQPYSTIIQWRERGGGRKIGFVLGSKVGLACLKSPKPPTPLVLVLRISDVDHPVLTFRSDLLIRVGIR